MKKSEMDSELTGPEMDAALQLIQLSGDSVETGGATAKTVEQRPEESAGDSNEISSNVGEIAVVDALPRRKKRFRLIDDIYTVTSPIKKRGKKSVK